MEKRYNSVVEKKFKYKTKQNHVLQGMSKKSHTVGFSITYSKNIAINCIDSKDIFQSKMHIQANLKTIS